MALAAEVVLFKQRRLCKRVERLHGTRQSDEPNGKLSIASRSPSRTRRGGGGRGRNIKGAASGATKCSRPWRRSSRTLCKSIVGGGPRDDALIMRQRWRGRRKLVSLDLTDVRKAVLKPAKLEEAYGAAWAALGIDGALLADPELDEEDLQELGVAVRLHRRRLLKDVARLRAQGVPEDVLEPTPREEPAAPAEPLPQRTVPRSVAAARAAEEAAAAPAVVPAAAPADRRGLRAQAGQAAGPEGRRAGGEGREGRAPGRRRRRRRPTRGQGQTDEGRRADGARRRRRPRRRRRRRRRRRSAPPRRGNRRPPRPSPSAARRPRRRRRRRPRGGPSPTPRTAPTSARTAATPRSPPRGAAPRNAKARGPAPGPDVKDDDPGRAEARRTEGVRLRRPRPMIPRTVTTPWRASRPRRTPARPSPRRPS